MRTERIPLGLTILGIIVGASSGLVAVQAAAQTAIIGGSVLALFGAIWQDRMGQPFVRYMTPDQWVPNEKDDSTLSLSISAKEHQRGKNVAFTVFQDSARGYEVVICSDEVDADGNVTVGISKHNRSAGKIVIK